MPGGRGGGSSIHSPPDYCVARVGPHVDHRGGSLHWLNGTALRAGNLLLSHQDWQTVEQVGGK